MKGWKNGGSRVRITSDGTRVLRLSYIVNINNSRVEYMVGYITYPRYNRIVGYVLLLVHSSIHAYVNDVYNEITYDG